MGRHRFVVELTRRAEKDIVRYKGFAQRVTRELLGLEGDPFLGHTLRGSLKMVRALEFSLPDGQHRAAYVVVEEKHLCLVFLVAPHENFYEKAERRFNALSRTGRIE